MQMANLAPLQHPSVGPRRGLPWMEKVRLASTNSVLRGRGSPGSRRSTVEWKAAFSLLKGAGSPGEGLGCSRIPRPWRLLSSFFQLSHSKRRALPPASMQGTPTWLQRAERNLGKREFFKENPYCWQAHNLSPNWNPFESEQGHY